MKKKYKMEKSLNINIGKTTDNFQMLEKLCQIEVQKLKSNKQIINGEITSVTFWTEDFPELIAIAKFTEDVEGNIDCKLSFDESTL